MVDKYTCLNMLKRITQYFNLNDLNLILTFAGFPIVTTLLPFVPSVPYRAFALLVALICLFKNGFHFAYGSKLMKWFLAFLFLVDFKALLQIVFASPQYQASALTAFLFVFGVVLIPVLAVFSGCNKIHWKNVLWILLLLLSLVILIGASHVVQTIAVEGEEMRMELNKRQSTLAFGDNSAYLILLASALLLYYGNSRNDGKHKLYWFFPVIAIILGIYGIAKAGSRGPFLSMLVGLIMLFTCMKVKTVFKIVMRAIVAVLVFGINFEVIENFAPVLTQRLTLTVEKGDLSGRDLLFQEAWRLILDHPIFGTEPLMFLNGGAFSNYHNGFLTVGLATGLLGFVGYVILIIAIVFNSLKHRNLINNVVYFFFISMLGACIMRSMSGASLADNPVYTLCVGLACLYCTRENSRINQTLIQ